MSVGSSYQLADGMMFGIFTSDVLPVFHFAMLRLMPTQGCSQQTHTQLHPFPSRSPYHPSDMQHIAQGWQGKGRAQGNPERSKEPGCSRDRSTVFQMNTTQGQARSSIPRAQPSPHLDKSRCRSCNGSL